MSWMVSVVVLAVLQVGGSAVDLGTDAARTVLVRAMADQGERRPGLELVLALGTLEELFGDWQGAEDLYEQGLLAFVDEPALILSLLRVHARDGRWAEARRLTDRLVAHAAFRARALLWRSMIHEALGEEQQARTIRDRALDELDVVLTDRTMAQRYLEQARRLVASAREGRWGQPVDSELGEQGLSPAAMRAELRQARRSR